MRSHPLATLVVTLAACLLRTPAGAAEETPTFTVTIRDGRVVPRTLEVPAGRRLKLVVRNEGTGPCEFENLDLRVEKVLAPGATSFVVIQPIGPGRYPFIDEFHPDLAGMDLVAR